MVTELLNMEVGSDEGIRGLTLDFRTLSDVNL